MDRFTSENSYYFTHLSVQLKIGHLTYYSWIFIRCCTKKVIWIADIRLATLGFGKFDEDLANDVAVKFLEELKNANLVKLQYSTILTKKRP